MSEIKPRKIVFIDRHFQGAFILKFLLLLLVGTGLFVLAAYVILDRRLGDVLQRHYTIRAPAAAAATLLARPAFVAVLAPP
jgi:hypothetical protein